MERQNVVKLQSIFFILNEKLKVHEKFVLSTGLSLILKKQIDGNIGVSSYDLHFNLDSIQSYRTVNRVICELERLGYLKRKGKNIVFMKLTDDGSPTKEIFNANDSITRYMTIDVDDIKLMKEKYDINYKEYILFAYICNKIKMSNFKFDSDQNEYSDLRGSKFYVDARKNLCAYVGVRTTFISECTNKLNELGLIQKRTIMMNRLNQSLASNAYELISIYFDGSLEMAKNEHK